jgi:TPR repeat protein
VKLYRAAADAGDGRALWSLGRLEERGDRVPKDVAKAYQRYAKAAERGLGDAAVDIALALQEGKVMPKDTARAYALLKSAADAGSAIAIYDLGKFAEDKLGGKPEEALPLYRRAAALGYPKGHRAAAVLLDEGLTVAPDPEAAADELLRAVAADAGAVGAELTGPKQVWTPQTVSALQRKLKGAGYYAGAVDGKSGPALAPALKKWRLYGDPRRAQSTK